MMTKNNKGRHTSLKALATLPAVAGLFLIFGCTHATAAPTPNADTKTVQTLVPGSDDPVSLKSVQEMPQYPGGTSALNKFINDNLQYPAEARKQNLTGEVIVNFTVDADGSLTDIHVAKSPRQIFSDEAVRVVKLMPKWIPGKQDGKAVRVQFMMPFLFKLTGAEVVPPPVKTTAAKSADDKVYPVVQKMPQYPGGEDAMYQYLGANLNYPQDAKDKNISGTVVCQFTVDTDGSLTDIKTLKSPNQLLTDEAIRLIESMPNWIPGKQDGKLVRVSYTLPIQFKLMGDTPSKPTETPKVSQ